MRLILRPINFVDINHFMPVDRIYLQQGNPGTYYAQLWDPDAGCGPTSSPPSGLFGLGGFSIPGGQRYIPTSTQTFKLLIQRTMTIAPVPSSQDFSVPLQVVDTRDGSLLKWNWSAAQIDVCISGGVYLQMTDSSTNITYTWTVDHFLQRRPDEVGM